MRKLMMIFVLLSSCVILGQEYDVYYSHTFISRAEPVNIRTGLTGGYNTYKDYNSGTNEPIADTSLEARHTNLNSLLFSAYISGTNGSFSGSDNDIDILVSLNTHSSFYTYLQGDFTGASYFGSVSLFEKMKISLKNNPECYKNKLIVSLNQEYPSAAIRWEFNPDGEGWRIIPESGLNIREISVSLEDLFAGNIENINGNINKTISFRVHNVLLNYNTESLQYNFFRCSPNLLPDLTTTNNTSCFGTNDGSVTLTFDNNVDMDNGYQMRYFVFDQNANLAFDPAKENPPQTIEQEDLDELTALNDGTGYYKGTLPVGLGKGHYKIVYQEFFDAGDGTDAIVKSGGVTAPFEIKEPTQIIPSANIAQAQCTENEAKINFSATGGNNLDTSGTYGYQYELNGDGNWITPMENPERVPATTIDQTVSIKAIYSINNCESEAIVLMEKINAIVPPLIFTNPSAGNTSSNSSRDAVISIHYGGGTSDHTFQLAKLNELNSAFEDVPNPNMINNVLSKRVEFRDLGIGTYRITMVDQNGCSLTTESLGDISVLSTPLPLLGLEEIGQITCPRAGDGTITVHVSGGVLDYSYQWTINNVVSPYGTTGSSTISMSDISEPGEYILKIASRGFTDFNDPSGYVSTTINLIAPEEVIILNASVNNITCNGAQDGSISITPSGGTSYQYKLDFFDSWTDLNANTIPISKGGFYDIYLRNGTGCEANPILDLLVEEPEVLLITEILPTNLSAVDSNDGAINITLEGGTLPYSYLWTGPNNLTFNTKDVVDLARGDYEVTVTDANDCTVSSPTIPIIDPTALLVTLHQTVPLECYGEDFAELIANVVGGTPPYTYEWFRMENGNNTQLGEDFSILGNLAAGTFFVRVTDINGASANASSITITQPDLLNIAVDNITDVSCNGYETGAIDISVTGGTAPYDYLWNNGAISEDLINLPSGTYSLEVLDDNGCRTEVEVTIGSPDAVLKITNENIKNASEYQGNDGSISFEILGGAAPYAITWTRIGDEQIVGNDRSISHLSLGNYVAFITDSNGCSLSKTYQIEQPDIVEETIVPISCSGQNDGSITILVNQADGVFGYFWNTGETTNTISNLSAGSYTVTVTGLGDAPLTRTYVIDKPLPLTVDLGGDKILCNGQVLELDATVEDASATYSWTSDIGFTSSEPLIKITATGNYSLIIFNSTGCSASGSVFVDISNEEISAEFAVSSQIFVGESLVAVDISYPLPEMVEWIIPENTSVKAKNEDELELLFTEPGEYEIGIITKRGLCEATQIKKVLVLEKDSFLNAKNGGHSQKKINDFIIYPNPTNGGFSADISLNEICEISLKIFSFASNTIIDYKKGKGNKLYNIPFDLSGSPSGVYAVLLETPYGNALRKIVIK